MRISDMKYKYPEHKLKSEFTIGTWGENDWQLGETNCVDRHYYKLPNESEWVVFKFCERTISGRKKCRWEVWHNGKWYNNYFTCYKDAIEPMENEIGFYGFDDDYRYYSVDLV